MGAWDAMKMVSLNATFHHGAGPLFAIQDVCFVELQVENGTLHDRLFAELYEIRSIFCGCIYNVEYIH